MHGVGKNGGIDGRHENESVARAIASNSDGRGGETGPVAGDGSLSRDVARSSSGSLSVAGVEHWMQLPSIAQRNDLSTIRILEVGGKCGGESNTQLGFLNLDLGSAHSKGHLACRDT
ncbi:MAG: hypothetical protein AMXMBFR36_25990 [Acidobacteriota bacterium]